MSVVDFVVGVIGMAVASTVLQMMKGTGAPVIDAEYFNQLSSLLISGVQG